MISTGDPRPPLGLRPIINAAGTETVFGASLARQEAITAAAALLSYGVGIEDLQRLASRVIAETTGAEAGYVTASAAAGITLSVAAAMTGADLAAIARLPATAGLASEVILQHGHTIDYGAPVEQGIRLSGASVHSIGDETPLAAPLFEAALNENTAAILHVVSHYCRHDIELPLADVVAIAHRHEVPVIVDAASEETFPEALRSGADLVIVSAHKFLRGLTAGIVAGRKDLVRAAFLQNRGIGRGMKVGKEGIAAAIAALRAWSPAEAEARRIRCERIVAGWSRALEGQSGIAVTAAPDPTGNPIVRLEVAVKPAAPFFAWELVDALAAGTPPIMVRAHEIEKHFLELDPATTRDDEVALVPPALIAALARLTIPGRQRTSLADWRSTAEANLLRWPD
jgi:L-seryl-tRNA(Ser) seleniumtransferase